MIGDIVGDNDKGPQLGATVMMSKKFGLFFMTLIITNNTIIMSMIIINMIIIILVLVGCH